MTTTYALATWWPGSDVDEDSYLDLVKIGETAQPHDRIRNLCTKSPLKLRLHMTIHPFVDAWAHALVERHPYNRRFEVAYQLGLPAPTEWYRGGCEYIFEYYAPSLRRRGITVRMLDWQTNKWCEL